MTDSSMKDASSGRRKLGTTKEVVEWIRDRIRRGQFVPGQRLVEADIIKDTGSSRGKVREALQRLETEGIVVIEEFRGASVKHFTWDQVRQIYRARAVLEGLAAAEFAAADAPEAKQRLQEIQDELDSSDATSNHEGFARLNDAWHSLILDEGGNEYVRQFLMQLTVPIYRLLFSSFYNSRNLESANKDHRLVTAAIVEGRVDDAERFMREHIHHGLQAISRIDPGFYD